MCFPYAINNFFILIYREHPLLWHPHSIIRPELARISTFTVCRKPSYITILNWLVTIFHYSCMVYFWLLKLACKFLFCISIQKNISFRVRSLGDISKLMCYLWYLICFFLLLFIHRFTIIVRFFRNCCLITIMCLSFQLIFIGKEVWLFY